MSTGQTPPPQQSFPFSAAALLCGLLTLALCWIPLVGILAFPLGAIALIAAALGIHQSRARGDAGRNLAIAGLVTGMAGLMVASYLFVVFLLGFRGEAWQGDWDDIRAPFRTESR